MFINKSQRTTYRPNSEEMATNNNKTTTLAVSDSADDLLCCSYNRQWYVIDERGVDEGGQVVSRVKKPMKVTAEQFSSFVNSSSDNKWREFLTPTNIARLRWKEGDFMYAVYDVEGFPRSNNILLSIPPEVGQKVFPKMHSDVSNDPEAFALPIAGDSEKRNRRNQDRIDALKWVPTDCQTTNNKGKTLKPCRPNLQNSTNATVPAHTKKLFDDMLKALQPKTSNGKRKMGSDKDAETNNIPDFMCVHTKKRNKLLPGMLWEVSCDLKGNTCTFEQIGGTSYLRCYKASDSGLGGVEEEAHADCDEEEDES